MSGLKICANYYLRGKLCVCSHEQSVNCITMITWSANFAHKLFIQNLYLRAKPSISSTVFEIVSDLKFFHNIYVVSESPIHQNLKFWHHKIQLDFLMASDNSHILITDSRLYTWKGKHGFNHRKLWQLVTFLPLFSAACVKYRSISWVFVNKGIKILKFPKLGWTISDSDFTYERSKYGSIVNCLHALLYLASLICGWDFIKNNLNRNSTVFYNCLFTPFYPTALKGCQGIIFIHGVWVGGRAGGQRGKVCPGCISKNVRCRKLILGNYIGWGM